MSSAPKFIWFCGTVLPADAPIYGAFDHGAMFGEGNFETVRLYGGYPYKLSEHVNRLKRNAAELGIMVTATVDELDKVICELGRMNGYREARIRIQVTPGEESTLQVNLIPADEISDDMSLIDVCRRRRSGVGVKTYAWKRVSGDANPLPHLKTLNYLENAWARKQSQKEGKFEAVFLTDRGTVAEGSRSNIFIVRGDGTVVTPPLSANILEGVTRTEVLSLLHHQNHKAMEGDFTLELKEAAEVFMTSTMCEVLPIIEVDGTRIANGAPGTLTRSLQKLYSAGVERFIADRDAKAKSKSR